MLPEHVSLMWGHTQETYMLDLTAIAAAIETRKAHLGRKWAEIARRGNYLDQSTVWHARQGVKELSEETYRRLDVGLDWPEGTLIAIGKGAPYPDEELTDMQRVERLEAAFDDLRSELATVASKVDRLIEALGDER